MGFKMKKPSMTQGTKGHREAVKNIKLNRNMDKTSLSDGRAGSSPFQKTGSPMKALDDRIARTEAKTAKLQEKKEAKITKGKAKAQAKADKLTHRADVKEAKAGVKEAKGKYMGRGRKMAKAEKLRAKAAAYTPPDETEEVTEDATKEIVKKVDEKPSEKPSGAEIASLVTGALGDRSAARAAHVGEKELPTYTSSYEKVKDKYKDKGGYDQYVKDAEDWWAEEEKKKSPTKHAAKAAGPYGIPHRKKYGKGHTEHNVKLTKEERGKVRRDVLGWDNPNKKTGSPAKNYKNPQDYKVFNYGNKPTPVKNKKKY